MKFRILFLSICTVAVAATAWYACGDCKSDSESAYIPRSEFKTAQSIDGAVEYTRLIKSNIYTGEVEQEDVVSIRQAVKNMSRMGVAKDDNLSWSSMGPTNVGGRSRTIVAYPDNANRLLTGGISGGLFRSENGGQTWELLPGFDGAVGVSSLAILANGSIYAATGHSREGGGSSFMGAGLFVSNDDGETFSVVSDFEPQPWDPGSAWAETNVIMPDPSNADRLWIGTNFGLRPYTHGDTELGAQPTGLNNSRVQDFVVSSSGQNIMVVQGVQTYASTDFGATFTQVNNGPYTTDQATSNAARTIDLAVSHTNENLFFSSVSLISGRLKGIYATLDAGQTWNVIAPSNVSGTSPFAPFGDNAQGWYDNTITVVPTEEGEDFNVIMGGIRLHRWESPSNVTPGITLWEDINTNQGYSPGLPPNPIYVHSDIQNSYWDQNGVLYFTTDGGIFKSTDNGATYSEINNNLNTTQYYALAFSPDGQVLGGLQDNGTLWLSLLSGSPGLATEFSGGDGFDTEISQEFPHFMFSSYVEGTMWRSTDGGANIAAFGDIDNVSNGGGNDFTTDMRLHENVNNEFSEQFVEYSPEIDNPYLELFPEGDFELTTEGDTIIGKIPAGTSMLVEADFSEFLLPYVTNVDINYYSYFVRTIDDEEFIYHDIADTARVQEKPQFMVAAPLSNGVYITRDPLSTNSTPRWYQMGDDNGSNATCVEFSPDGDHLYVGYGNGELVRFSGLNNAWLPDELTYNETEYEMTRTVIYNGSGAITDIDVDYSMGQGTTAGEGPASERVAITIGNYGGNGKVRVSDNAATTTNSSSFDNIWNVDNSIAGMPCYSIVMDVSEPNKLIVGTEYGTWYTENNGDTWANVNNGDMVRVPVYDLRQQKRPEWKVENSGVVYAATHGRGVFKTDFLYTATTSIEDYGVAEAMTDLVVYPNPLADAGTVKFDMGVTGEVSMRIFSLDGRLVETKSNVMVEAGKEKQLRFNAADLATGSYIVQLQTGETTKTVKFVKSN